jgi:hypothetical protein
VIVGYLFIIPKKYSYRNTP